MRNLGYNSNQFAHTLPVLIREFASPFQMFEALAEYYAANGYFVNVPARSYRYQVLLDFACFAAADKAALFIELLTFDLYLRENIKSRPEFCREEITDRKKLRSFYEKEEKTPCYLKDYQGSTAMQLSRMTHIEGFFYPVWKDCTQKLETPAYILFDYKNRSALTHDAAFYEILL